MLASRILRIQGKMSARPEEPIQDEQNTTEPLIGSTQYTHAVLPSQGDSEMILDATAPHTRVDNFVIDEYLDRIGAVGLGIYTVIKRHYNWTTGQCTPSYNRIAEMCKVSRRTVMRYVKRLKEVGIIDPQMRFTDDGQTSNQYVFYQPKRPKKPVPKRAQTSTSTQMDTTEQMSKSPSDTDVTPPVTQMSPDQVVLNKKEEEENTKTVPAIEDKKKENKKEASPATQIAVSVRPKAEDKKAAPTEKQKACIHPYAEVVTLSDGITICNHCYDLINYEPDAEAA